MRQHGGGSTPFTNGQWAMGNLPGHKEALLPAIVSGAVWILESVVGIAKAPLEGRALSIAGRKGIEEPIWNKASFFVAISKLTT